MGRDQLTLYEIHRRGELREHFGEAMLDEEQVKAGLASGDLVVDERLARFLAATGEDGAPAGERLAVQLTARRAFALAERANTLETELAVARSSLAEREQELHHTRAHLEEVSARFEQLRASRLVRWTQPLRRAYYRARGAAGPETE